MSVVKTLLGAIVLAALLLLGLCHLRWQEVFGQQLAHGDAAWIQAEERFKDASGVHCCGPADCSKAPKGAIIEHDGHIVIRDTGQKFTYKQAGSYISIDGDWWWCVRGIPPEVKCVFRPQGGV